MDNLQDAQSDMRGGYGYGSMGIIASGIVWIFSSAMVHFQSSQKGIWALIIGGMCIVPLAKLLEKIMGLRGGHDKNNPLGKLAMEGTIWMLMCIPLAYGLSFIKAEWFFQGMLIIIGGRYLTFASIYGLRLYWALGATLGLAAYALFIMRVGAFSTALTGGLIEVVFGLITYGLFRNDKN
jgi:hypothetical protein